MISGKVGTTIRMSVSIRRTVSILPPLNPATKPTVDPSVTEMIAARTDTVSDTGKLTRIIPSQSRPKRSVPSGCFHDGSWKIAPDDPASGTLTSGPRYQVMMS